MAVQENCISFLLSSISAAPAVIPVKAQAYLEKHQDAAETGVSLKVQGEYLFSLGALLAGRPGEGGKKAKQSIKGWVLERAPAPLSLKEVWQSSPIEYPLRL